MAKAESLGQAWMKGISGELAIKVLRADIPGHPPNQVKIL